MLRSGGSAIDAAIAASAVLSITAPHLCGLGGDLFAIVHDGTSVRALDASGRSGSGSDGWSLRAEGHLRMPFRHDVRSVTVPGCVEGWIALHDRFGRSTLDESSVLQWSSPRTVPPPPRRSPPPWRLSTKGVAAISSSCTGRRRPPA